MDDIKKRLQETSEECFIRFEAWSKDKKDGKAREALEDSIHELRKVASRLEIEMAVSENGGAPQKALPIPPHRDARRRSADDDNRGNNGNDAGNGNDGGGQRKSRGPRKRPSSGGGNS